MIAAILVWQLTAAPSASPVRYENVPPEVVRISVRGWSDEGPPVSVSSVVERHDRRLLVDAQPGRRSLVLLERADGAYLLDGPFWWPSAGGDRVLDGRWRRTITVTSVDPLPGAIGFEWLSAGPEPTGGWPRCFRSGDRVWACWGAAAVGEPGVLIYRDADRIAWTVYSGGSMPNLRTSRWGRLIVLRGTSDDPPELRVRFAHPVLPSSQRVRGLRVETATTAGAHATAVAPGIAWLSGDDVPKDAWVDVRTAQLGPAYLPLQDVAGGSPSLPLVVRLDESRSLDGLAVGPRDERAGGALVTMFRMIDPPSSIPGPAAQKPRRVLVAETIADATGVFHLSDVGEADYEVVVWHPQLGRASSALSRTAGVLTVRLESPGTVRGRVLAAGKPLAGVDVISLPGPEAFRNADDLIELKGGDTRTGSDGRFAVILAASGGGELRVGGGTFAIRRFPLPRVPAPLVDLGDIDLGSPLAITIVLDQESACDVRATGPIGRSGLQIIMGSRTGPGLFRMVLPEPGQWAFGLLCGRDAHPLSPMTMPIGPADAGKEVRFSVR